MMFRIFLALALAMAVFVVNIPAAEAKYKSEAQCTNNGNCCRELNAFWKQKSYDGFEEPSGSQEIRISDSDKYFLTKPFSCPSARSQFVEGFKLLFDFSKSGDAEIDYYGRVVSITRDKNYVFWLEPLTDAFADTQYKFSAIVFSAHNIRDLSPSTVASNIVHEAEHVLSKKAHVKCDHGQRKGVRSCDVEFIQELSTVSPAISWQFLFCTIFDDPMQVKS